MIVIQDEKNDLNMQISNLKEEITKLENDNIDDNHNKMLKHIKDQKEYIETIEKQNND